IKTEDSTLRPFHIRNGVRMSLLDAAQLDRERLVSPQHPRSVVVRIQAVDHHERWLLACCGYQKLSSVVPVEQRERSRGSLGRRRHRAVTVQLEVQWSVGQSGNASRTAINQESPTFAQPLAVPWRLKGLAPPEDHGSGVCKSDHITAPQYDV